MAKIYDFGVIGLGAMGSAALSHLSTRGSVIGIEQFTRAHSKGSSHGQSRMFRQTYEEHPDYVPLVQEAGRQFKAMGNLMGQELCKDVGCLSIGTLGSQSIAGALKSAKMYNLPYTLYDRDQVNELFPQFYFESDQVGLMDHGSMIIFPELAINTYLDHAEQNGAVILENTKVVNWKENDVIEITLEDGSILQLNKLVITAGPFSESLLNLRRGLLKVTRQFVVWLEPDTPSPVSSENMHHCWSNETDDTMLYGFPMWDNMGQTGPVGLKVGGHFGHQSAEIDPYNNPDLTTEEIENFRKMVIKRFPGSQGKVIEASKCMYTMSPDEHFIIDHIGKRCIFAAGFSGHGFKFMPVIGNALADMATEGRTDLPIDFLSLARFSKF